MQDNLYAVEFINPYSYTSFLEIMEVAGIEQIKEHAEKYHLGIKKIYKVIEEINAK
jgi:hypothetical protein